jgi:hypothetical protein
MQRPRKPKLNQPPQMHLAEVILVQLWQQPHHAVCGD